MFITPETPQKQSLSIFLKKWNPTKLESLTIFFKTQTENKTKKISPRYNFTVQNILKQIFGTLVEYWTLVYNFSSALQKAWTNNGFQSGAALSQSDDCSIWNID